MHEMKLYEFEYTKKENENKQQKLIQKRTTSN